MASGSSGFGSLPRKQRTSLVTSGTSTEETTPTSTMAIRLSITVVSVELHAVPYQRSVVDKSYTVPYKRSIVDKSYTVPY